MSVPNRLQDVLKVGMDRAGTSGSKRALDGGHRSILSDPDQPLFLLIVKEKLNSELTKLESEEWALKSHPAAPKSRPQLDSITYVDEYEYEMATPQQNDEYTTLLRSHVARRDKLTKNLKIVEQKLMEAMTPDLREKYHNMTG